MKDKRLPPQPADTALARAVRRWVDRLPNTSIGKRRELDALINKQAAKISALYRENYYLTDHVAHLRKDISKLVQRHAVPFPSVERLSAGVERSEMSMDYAVRVGVKYADQWVQQVIPDKMVKLYELSEVGERAVKDAARRISLQTAEEHAKHIAHAVLRKGIFDNLRGR